MNASTLNYVRCVILTVSTTDTVEKSEEQSHLILATNVHMHVVR